MSADSPQRIPLAHPPSTPGIFLLTLVDVSLVPLVILWTFWHPTFVTPVLFCAIPLWILCSFIIHGDTLNELGIRLDNFGISMRWSIGLTVSACAAVCVVAVLNGSVHRPLSAGITSDPGVYFTLCLVEQLFLNSFLSNRLLLLIHRPTIAAILAGGIFATLHWPNPFMMVLTFGGGALMAFLFARNRNVLSLAIGQWAFVMVMFSTVPASLHHNLVVGPAYFRSRDF